MMNELKLIEALKNVAKSFGYNTVDFTEDKYNGVTIHFEEPDYVELKADGKTIEKIVKE